MNIGLCSSIQQITQSSFEHKNNSNNSRKKYTIELNMTTVVHFIQVYKACCSDRALSVTLGRLKQQQIVLTSL